MATLLLTAAGTAMAGPIGATIGALIGSQIDGALFAPRGREGPRLQDLRITTSSYGSPIARHFGRMRAAGTIVWATDLKESTEKQGGGKGRPSVTTYSYSSSFAVALASRPIAGIGRIWADGNLLRGAAGDLKVGGALRVYTGAGDQQPDPLIASAEGSACPAFRGLAYCVFEELQLADFGNRVPALTFEVIADNGEVRLTDLLRPLGAGVQANRPLTTLEGYSEGGGALAETLATLDQVFPLASNAAGDALLITDGDPDTAPVTVLPEPVVDRQGDRFGGSEGRAQQLRADDANVPAGLRYFDIARDFQAGLQRAGGRATPGRHRLIEFPGALHAGNARKLADEAAARARWSQDRLAYRIAEIDTALMPGQVVALPSAPGKWRIEAWEWREHGLELELLRLPQRKGHTAATEAGRSLPQTDLVATPTLIEAFELPWDGNGSADRRQIFVAASSSSAGWTGAALYAQTATGLLPLGATGRDRSILGTTVTPLPGRPAVLADRQTTLDVSLAAADFVLESRSIEDLAQGANRALVGEEIIQFANAEALGGSQWRLSGLLRGRGGTEHLAIAGLPAGASFVLLDSRPVALDPAELGQASAVAAIGLADTIPVVSELAAAGCTLRPLAPVHPRVTANPDGSWQLRWTRRARGAWAWNATVDVPLVEQAEAYEIGLGDTGQPILTWQSAGPSLLLETAIVAQLQTDHAGAKLWVRQIGTYARSLPLLLTTID